MIGIQNLLEFSADTDTEDEGDKNLTGLISVPEIHSEAEFTFNIEKLITKHKLPLFWEPIDYGQN